MLLASPHSSSSATESKTYISNFVFVLSALFEPTTFTPVHLFLGVSHVLTSFRIINKTTTKKKKTIKLF